MVCVTRGAARCFFTLFLFEVSDFALTPGFGVNINNWGVLKTLFSVQHLFRKHRKNRKMRTRRPRSQEVFRTTPLTITQVILPSLLNGYLFYFAAATELAITFYFFRSGRKGQNLYRTGRKLFGQLRYFSLKVCLRKIKRINDNAVRNGLFL